MGQSRTSWYVWGLSSIAALLQATLYHSLVA